MSTFNLSEESVGPTTPTTVNSISSFKGLYMYGARAPNVWKLARRLQEKPTIIEGTEISMQYESLDGLWRVEGMVKGIYGVTDRFIVFHVLGPTFVFNGSDAGPHQLHATSLLIAPRLATSVSTVRYWYNRIFYPYLDLECLDLSSNYEIA